MSKRSRASISRSSIATSHRRVWRMEPQEEFIWAMRLQRVTEGGSDDSTTESEDELTLEMMEKSTSGILPDYYSEKMQRQVQLFSSFVPDAALEDLNNYTTREIECCMLFGRINGLHQLVDKYRNMKADSRLKLTTEINEFFGAIVQEILLNGGDIVKFSPASIVAIWRTTKLSNMSQNVHVALDCTLVVQKTLSQVALGVGEKVSAQFAITAGSVFFRLIGDENCSTYLMCGSMYEDVRKARKEIILKNIIVAPNAIQYIHSFEYEIDQVEGYAFFQVIGLTAMWKQVRRPDYQDVDLEGFRRSSISAVSLTGRGSLMARTGSTNEFYLRPALIEVADNPESFLQHISKFCQKGIRAGISENQPIENFVELRDVSIVAIKIETSISKTGFMMDLSDEIYKIVSRYALKYLGYPDYLATHDNKTFMGVTFGLRNCSHVMQQKSALKCAHKIMATIKVKDQINTVSIGVSTGKIYHTIIGHPLRQALTMFGKTVTTATNLAAAFNGRIVCDDDTFLHSKMDADCFGSISKDQMHVVEEIHSASIYELLSDEIPHKDKIPIYDHPTIGRDKEISIFITLLDKFIQTSKISIKDPKVCSALLIKAYPKEGKTRLLHELVKMTPRYIPARYLSLSHGNEEVPFFFMKKFFSILFGSDLQSLEQIEQEKRILSKLKDFNDDGILWVLNPVFEVKFPEPEDSANYKKDEKLQMISKVLTFLCRKMFPDVWLLALDDTEFIDEESWKILVEIRKHDMFFLVMTCNRDRSLRSSSTPIFSWDSNVTTIKLDSLSPNYFGAIACQHFNVMICSSDLEYLLQKKSDGNVGYIKNLLTNLLNRGYIYVRELNINELGEENLIPQSLVLLIPMTESRKKRMMNFIIKKGRYDNNEFKRVLWFLFVESMQGSKYYDLRGKIYKTVLKSEKVKACFLKKSLAMSTLPGELTTSIRVTQIFEMLTYPEQMILKCCSVLGDSFSRMVLEHVLTLDYYTLLAPAVQSFFEMGILCCGRGDFSDGAQFKVIREKCVDPQFDEDLSCKCTSIFQERYRNLPDYAYCGFLRFKNPRFRERIYEQLRQSQKIDCHGKVMIFLHEETKRCRSCGRDAFNWDNKKRLDDYNEDLKKEWLGRKKAKKLEREFDSVRTAMHELFYDGTVASPSIHRYSIKNSSFVSLDLSIRTEFEPTAKDLEVYSVKKVFGPMHILKASTDVALVRTFSTMDFSFCECVQILSAYFRDMIIHCRGAGQHTKLYENMQKYAYLCIYNRNISEAQNILKQAYPCINDIFEMPTSPPKWKKQLYEGKLSTISALAYVELGLYDDAIVEVRSALRKLEVIWPKSNFRKMLNLATERIKRVLTFFAFPEMNTKNLSNCICEYYVDVAEALNLYGKLLMIKKHWKSAELACSWALCKALSAQTDFCIICDCFSNMIMVCIHNKKLYLCEALQVHALRYCYRKTNRVESWELASVCKMYFSVMIFKFMRSQMNFAIHLGYIIVKIGSCLNDTEKLLIVSSYLMTLLVSKLYLQEACNLLLEMEFFAEEIDDLKAQMWFHSQALFFQIETGYSIVPFQQCVDMFDIHTRINEESDFVDVHNRYGILMWLWYLRNEQWESASQLNEFIEASYLTKVGKGSIRAVISMLYILEGKLLLYVNKLNVGNIWECKKLDHSVKQIMVLLFKESKFFTWILPRLLFLKTYYFHINNNEKKYLKWMIKTKKAADDCGSEMIREWCNHVQKAWKLEMSRKRRNFWRDHCEENNLFFFQQFDPGLIPVKEEIIWSMRSSAREALGTSEVDHRGSIFSTRDSMMSTTFSRAYVWDPVKQKANIMASFVPDEVLKDDFLIQDMQEIKCCLLYGRVSGLNKLVTEYLNQGNPVISELTEIVNKTMGHMVQEVLAYGGDVLKFGVTNLIAIWKCEGETMMGTLVHLALDCAIVINKHCNYYLKEHNMRLSVQLGVTAGELLVTYLGDENKMNLVVFGNMIRDIEDIRKNCKTDDIISSAISLKYVYANEYIHEAMDDKAYFKISGLSAAWRQVTRMMYMEETQTLNSSSSSSANTATAAEDHVFSLRPITMKLYFEDSVVTKMKKFLKESVLRSIEFEEPLQNLSEIRQIVMAAVSIKTFDISVSGLITIGKESVKIFQRNALRFYGNVHHIEFFYNTITILVAFGLRGFKHTLECKNCLLISLNSMNEIKSVFPNLESVSVGICKGKSFCTTVGQSLRRDYIVMGSTAVRAELMSATYVNKVTCDETVFLHSKLGHDSFKLQERVLKYTRFFTDTIYEFLQEKAVDPTVLVSYPYPSVGNEVEIDLFKTQLQKWFHGSDDLIENILIIKGFSKEGKTRLMHDMIANREPGIPVNYFRLLAGDEDKPFCMIAKLFVDPLGFKPNMKIYQKKTIIKKFLPTVKGLKKLKAVYEALQLVPSKIKMTPLRLKMIKECLVELCKESFKTPWLIAIDDANFMDSISWDVIQPLIDTNLLFLLMSCQRGYQLTETKIHEKRIAAVLRLKGLQKKYIATFACQVMDVCGIPADLEFALHKKSNGNPGWISNLLVFLLENGSLVVKEVPCTSLRTFGLICPPMTAIFRMTKKQEKQIAAIINLAPNKEDKRRNINLWNVLSDAFSEPDEEDLYREQAIYRVFTKSDKCRVCFLSESFSMENFDGEETREVFVAQILDTLTYNEQIFLKCCSILGVTFLRDVLYFVNPGSVHFEFAEIVQKMFEKQILVCAGGDFTEKPTLIRKKMKDPDYTDSFVCNCTSLIIEDGHKHLPKYASCGYLRFRATSLREVVYNSLNKEQRIEFHTKAITYLQEQLKKCVACGGGQFNIGLPNQAALMKKKKTKKKKNQKKEKRIEIIPTEGSSDRQFSLYLGDSPSVRSSMVYRISKSLSGGSSNAAIQASYFELFNDSSDEEDSIVFSKVIQHYKNRAELTRTFSYTDFSFCECDEKLSDYYYQMIIHYRGKEQLLPMFQNMIDYVKSCLLFENISEATRVSREAHQVIEKIFTMNELQYWKKPLLQAKVFNLEAQILIFNGNRIDALKLLLLAMKKYNRPLPTTNIMRILKIKWHKWRILISALFNEHTFDYSISLEQYLYYCDLSETLGLLAEIYMASQKFTLAELTALWSLTKALTAKANPAKIHLAYERVLRVYEFLPAPKTKILLETMALLHCHKMKYPVEFEEFRAITKLYSTLSRIRFQLGEIKNSIDLGCIAVKMFFTQRFNQQFRYMLVLLSTCLLWGWSLQESAKCLSELNIYTTENEDLEGRILYYSQAMYFHSLLGYGRVSYEQCKMFWEENSINKRTLKNRIGINRLHALMWLWCVRNDYWEEADTYMSEINEIIQSLTKLETHSLHSALILTEGYLLFLVYKLDQMNIFDIPNILEKIHFLFDVLDKYKKMYLVVEPMVMILKAYYLHIKNRDTDCFKMMEESIKLSQKHSDLYHEKFGEYLIKAWKKQLQPDVLNFWKNHSFEETLLDYVVLFEEEDHRVGFFTYPTPKYINTGILPNAGNINWKKIMKLKKTHIK